MNLTRRAAKRDANESEIVDALVAIGASVEKLSMDGAPDLLVGWRGTNWLLEVKTRKGELNDGQQVWHAHWNGQVTTVRSADEALSVIGAIFEYGG